ncbi:MAG: PIN domain-containing protein [Candidatus Micrarchaeota archaeon]
MSNILVVDSFAWMEYFAGNGNYRRLIDEGSLLTPSVVVAEIARTLKRKGLNDPAIDRQLAIIKRRSAILDLDFEHARKAGIIAEEKGLHFADALIYSFASEKELLLTGDRHFEKLEFAKVVK